MGNCTCTSKLTKTQFKAKLIQLIADNKLARFKALFASCTVHRSGALKVDEVITSMQGALQFNALAYAIKLGRLEFVQYLVEEAQASLSPVSKPSSVVMKTPLDLVCENGSLPILEYLLPKIDNSKQTGTSEPDEKTEHSPSAMGTTAVQRACERGHFPLVKFIYAYYRDNPKPPKECDLHYVDEISGENCALLAAKARNLELLRYLHSEVKADFTILNKRRESALQIAIVSGKLAKVPCLPVVRFLVEEVGLEPSYEYEETLLIAEEQAIVAYLERRLIDHGINVNKVLLELKYSVCKQGNSSVDLHDQRDKHVADISSISVVAESQIWTPLEWSEVL
jgi:ankyrin repeat protein